MLHSINWIQFFTALLILVTIYYAYVLKRFYYSDFISRFKGQQSNIPALFRAPVNTTTRQVSSADEGERETEDVLSTIEDLTDRVKASIIKSAASRGDYPSLVADLKMILKDYPNLKISEFRPSINELIHAECEKTGFIILNKEDVNDLWEV